MSWFEEWFDSPYYHLLYENRSEQEATEFINRVSAYLQMRPGARVLDAACGKGRHARVLAQLGMEVTGIDLSENSIRCAKKFENEHLKFEVYDLREVYKPGEFDYVFNLFSSFGYCDDEMEDQRALDAFAGDLKTGGTMVLDYLNTEAVVRFMKPREIVQRGEIQFHIQRRVENGFIRKKIEFLAGGENYSFEEQLKVINRFKFEAMLKESGLHLKKVFGNYELSEFESGTSPRLILVAKKDNEKPI